MWKKDCEKNFLGSNLGPKMPKNRVFRALWKFCSLVFPDFLYKDVELKCTNCEKQFFSKIKFFGSISAKKCPKIGFFVHVFCSLVFPDFLYKDVELKCPNCEIKKKFSKKNFFGPIWAQKCPKIGFFGLCEKSVH